MTKSPSLAEIQAAFQDRLLTGDDRILKMLGAGGPFMKVYDHAYRARLEEILAEDFEGLHTLAGDDQFTQILAGYLKAHPSKNKSIRWIGESLPQWLAEEEPWRDLPQLRDMAAFEWSMGLVFDAPNDRVLGLEAMAEVPPEAWPQVTFRCHQALFLEDFSWDVAPFKQAILEEKDPTAAPAPYDAAVTFAFWRHPENLIVHYRPLAADEAAGIRALQEGRSFGVLCEVLAELGDPETAAVRAAGLLKVWIESGWLSGVTVPGMSIG